MPKNLAILLPAIACAVAACDSGTRLFSRGACRDALQEIESDPAQAAQRAISAGDQRLLLIRGYTTSAPGVPDSRLEGRYRYRTLEKTSDTPEDSSCVEYQDAARRYAERYNVHMQRLIEQRGT